MDLTWYGFCGVAFYSHGADGFACSNASTCWAYTHDFNSGEPSWLRKSVQGQQYNWTIPANFSTLNWENGFPLDHPLVSLKVRVTAFSVSDRIDAVQLHDACESRVVNFRETAPFTVVAATLHPTATPTPPPTAPPTPGPTSTTTTATTKTITTAPPYAPGFRCVLGPLGISYIASGIAGQELTCK